MYCHQGNMGLFRDDYTLHIALISFKKKKQTKLKTTVHVCAVKITLLVMNHMVVQPTVLILHFMSCNTKVSGLAAILGVLCSNKSVQLLHVSEALL